MSQPTYSKADLRQFDHLTDRLSHRDQMARINARLELKRFMDEHGKEKCDAMFEVLKVRDAKRRA